MITRNANIIIDGMPSISGVRECIQEFLGGTERLKTLESYYNNSGAIRGRIRRKSLPNNRLAHAYSQYIVSVASGYLVGSPVQYTAKGDMDALLDVYRRSKMSSVDSELAESASIYGVGVELVYFNEKGQIKSAKVDRFNAFVVYDDTVEARPLLGIRWVAYKDNGTKHY